MLSILFESIQVYFLWRSFVVVSAGRRFTCIRFSISNFPARARAGTPHNATSLIQGGQYIPESIDKMHNTRIRKLPFPRHANAPAFSDRCVSLLFHHKRVSIAALHIYALKDNHTILILWLRLIVFNISHRCNYINNALSPSKDWNILKILFYLMLACIFRVNFPLICILSITISELRKTK